MMVPMLTKQHKKLSQEDGAAATLGSKCYYQYYIKTCFILMRENHVDKRRSWTHLK
jgi:hypothetical protein